MALSALKQSLGRVARTVGRTLDNVGLAVQGSHGHRERAVFNTQSPFQGKAPSIPSSSFVAPNATVIGDVKVGENSSIWYETVIRADVNHVKIGSQTNIMDRVIIHVAKHNPKGFDAPTIVGDRVTVAPGATLHACTLHDECVVGMGAQVLDGAVVESQAVVAPGSIVPPGKRVVSGQLWAGNPAQYVRDLTEEEKRYIVRSSDDTYKLALFHKEENSKTYLEVLADEARYEDDLERNDSSGINMQGHLRSRTENTERELVERGLW